MIVHTSSPFILYLCQFSDYIFYVYVFGSLFDVRQMHFRRSVCHDNAVWVRVHIHPLLTQTKNSSFRSFWWQFYDALFLLMTMHCKILVFVLYINLLLFLLVYYCQFLTCYVVLSDRRFKMSGFLELHTCIDV